VLDPFLLSLGLKLLAAAAVVIVVALLVDRAGPFIGAMIVTLPISTGPSYVFLAMDHTAEFMSATALASLVANAATPIFMGTYARLACRHGVIVSIVTALLVWAGFVTASTAVEWDLRDSLLLNVVCYSIGGLMLKGLGHAQRSARPATKWWDLPMRALTVMVLCAAVILVAHRLGPKAAGLVALAPMGFVTMALVVHPRAGGRTSAAVVANSLPGMIGFVAALLMVHVTAIPLGSWSALLAALATSMVWNGSLIAVKRVRSATA
jgi:hypothetical protein